eukprot:752324-Hanusia_phi.AAC.4
MDHPHPYDDRNGTALRLIILAGSDDVGGGGREGNTRRGRARSRGGEGETRWGRRREEDSNTGYEETMR